jgi:hypothetical protein
LQQVLDGLAMFNDRSAINERYASHAQTPPASSDRPRAA